MVAIVFLAVVGFCLLAAEVFLPGAILGGLGVLCLIASIVVAFATEGVATGLLTAILVLIGSGIGFVVWLRLFPRTSVGRGMMLTTAVVADDRAGEWAELIGQTGVAESALRPVGTGRIAGVKMEIVTQGEFLEPGTPVVVVRADGSGVLVRKRDAESPNLR